jgi:putative tricarboxylic transport membrane protein
MSRSDLIAGVILFALAIAAIGYGSRIPFGSLPSPQAGFFPVLIAIFLAVLSLILIGQGIKKCQGKTPSLPITSWGGRPLLLTIGALFAYIIFFESLGYLISTFLLMAFLLEAIRSKKWWVILLFALFTTMSSYFLMGVLLQTPLPSGLL